MIRATHGEIAMLRAGRAQQLLVPAHPVPGAPSPRCPLKMGQRYAILAPATIKNGEQTEKRQKITATASTAVLHPDGQHYHVTFLARVDIEHPLFLGRSGGYTTLEHLAMPDEPEPVHPGEMRAQQRAASQRDQALRQAKSKPVSPALQEQLDSSRRLERQLGEELDLEHQDLTPHEVAMKAPHQGDATHVRERRRRMGRRGIDGRTPFTPAQRAEAEQWLMQRGASVREIERCLDISRRAAHDLQQAWTTEQEQAA